MATPSTTTALEHARDRQTHIAERLLLNRARTQTVQRFTGLSRDRLATLRHRLGITEETRLRGPSPYSMAQLMRSPRLRDEGAAVATLCIVLHAIRLPSPSPRTFVNLFTLKTAERLCDAFELLKECIPGAQITFEQTVLLALALSRGDSIVLIHCDTCSSAQLFDRMGSPHAQCRVCAQRLPTSLHPLVHSVESATYGRTLMRG